MISDLREKWDDVLWDPQASLIRVVARERALATHLTPRQTNFGRVVEVYVVQSHILAIDSIEAVWASKIRNTGVHADAGAGTNQHSCAIRCRPSDDGRGLVNRPIAASAALC